MKKILTRKVDNRLFELTVKPVRWFDNTIIKVIVREVTHPNRRYFRTTYLCENTFWVDEVPSLWEGAEMVLTAHLERERHQKKVEEFFTKSKDGA